MFGPKVQFSPFLVFASFLMLHLFCFVLCERSCCFILGCTLTDACVQARGKANMRRKMREDDEEEQEMVRQKLMEEDMLFDKYTKALIEQYAADGKPTKPLLLELAKMKAQGR